MQRLDKLLASQGMLSRREVKELITKGRVTIDGTVEKHPERKVTRGGADRGGGGAAAGAAHPDADAYKPQGLFPAARDAG